MPPANRAGSGVIVVDKPADMSSAGVVRIVKRQLGARKVGHAGTLDPFATGVLVCCINRATRLADFFLRSDKVYRAVMVLGVATDTQDATGTVIARSDAVNVSPATLRRTFARFTGDIRQQPPVFSALKHKGVPLYKLARDGRPVTKAPRTVSIMELELLSAALPEVSFQVHCSAGTYIRTLCADIGSELGCGAHLQKLRRLKSGGFTIQEAIGLDDFTSLVRQGHTDRCMIGMADALRQMPGCVADDQLIEKIFNGRVLRPADLAAVAPDMPVGIFKVVDKNSRLAAVLQRKPDGETYDYRCVFPN